MAIVALLLILVAAFLFFASVILPLVLWTRIKELERLVGRLQKRVSALETTGVADDSTAQSQLAPSIPPAELSAAEPSLRTGQVESEPPPVTAAPAPAIGPSPSARGAQASLETVIAGRWLNRVGLTLVFFAVAYFIEWSIDNDWIGPTGQVASGVLVGAALLVASQILLKRGYAYFSEGVTGLGAGVLYLALWAGCNYYHLFSLNAGFVGMVAVTLAVVAIAVGRDSQRTASLALAGGFLTPVLASSGMNAQVALFTYLAVLDGGLLLVAWQKNWRWLELPAFVLTLLYFWGWYDRFYYPEQPLVRTTAFATLFFLEFSALPIVRSRRTGAIRSEQIALLLLNGPLYLLAIVRLLYESNRWATTFGALALAAFHLLILRAIPQPEQGERQSRLTRLLFAGLALTFVTLAIPIRLDGKWITIAFSVEGAVLTWTGFRVKVWQLRAAAFVLFALVAARLAIELPPGGRFLFNERFATLLVTAASFGVAVGLARRFREGIPKGEAPIYGALSVSANFMVLWALSAEGYDYFSPRGGGGLSQIRMSASLARQLTLSIVWTAYALALIGIGVRRREAALRWQALVLFGATVVKVFFYDMSFLSGGYRVASSVVLGLVLLGVSFVYQRQLTGRKLESA